MDKVRVKTSQGYWFTEGRGYGRMYGTKLQGEILCKKHAKAIVKMLWDVGGMHADTERFRGHAVCAQCNKGKS